MPLLTRLPGGPGLVKANAVTVPQPGHVAEPTTDAGYTRTGDASAVGNELAPSLLVDYLNATRLLNTIEPDYWDAVLSIVSRRFDEQQNRALVVGDTSDSPLENGLYGLTGIGSTANLTAAITTTHVEAALSRLGPLRRTRSESGDCYDRDKRRDDADSGAACRRMLR